MCSFMVHLHASDNDRQLCQLNGLAGTLPSSWGTDESWPAMTSLALNDNQLSGHILPIKHTNADRLYLCVLVSCLHLRLRANGMQLLAHLYVCARWGAGVEGGGCGGQVRAQLPGCPQCIHACMQMHKSVSLDAHVTVFTRIFIASLTQSACEAHVTKPPCKGALGGLGALLADKLVGWHGWMLLQ